MIEAADYTVWIRSITFRRPDVSASSAPGPAPTHMADDRISSLQRRRLLQALGLVTASAIAPRGLRPLLAQSGAIQLFPGIRFEEIAQRAGLNFVTRNCATPNKNQPETMVAGVALFDYDNDGFLDIYCVNGAAIPSLEEDDTGLLESPLPQQPRRHLHRRDRKGRRGRRRLRHGRRRRRLRQRRHGRTSSSPTSPATSSSTTTATAPSPTSPTKAGVAGAHARRQEDVVRRPPAGSTTTTTACSTCSSSNYCNWEVNKEPFCALKAGQRAYCHPKNYQPLPNTLYRNNGDGTFTDVSQETGIDAFFGKGMGVGLRRLRRRRLHRTSSSPTTPCPTSCSTTSAARSSRRWPSRPAWPTRRRQRHLRHGRRFPRHRQRRPARHLAHRHRERDIPALPQPGDGTFVEPTASGRRRSRNAHHVRLVQRHFRLRQRRLEGPVRRPRQRHGQHRGHPTRSLRRAELRASATSATASSQRRQRRAPGRLLRSPPPTAARRSATSTTTAASTPSSPCSTARSEVFHNISADANTGFC